MFLAVAEFVGFRAGGRLPFEWLYWILYCPLWAPLAPLDSYRSFLSAQKEHELWSFQSIPLLINSINLKRDGVRICLGKDVGRWSGVAGVATDWWMLPGWCCIAIAALELGNGDSWCHMCAFRFHFWGRKVNWNQASHVRASSVPTLYACCLTERSCHFLFVARVGLCCWFCDFAVSFLVPPDGPKNGTVKVLFFCSFTKQCMRSQKWDRQAVPFLGPCLGSFFEVFCIKVAEAQRFGFNEALWLMGAGRATREALLSEAGFENVFRTQNWARRRKLFCRWFCFLLGPAGCISVAAWTQLKVAFYYFVSSGGLIVCC